MFDYVPHLYHPDAYGTPLPSVTNQYVSKYSQMFPWGEGSLQRSHPVDRYRITDSLTIYNDLVVLF